MGKIKKARAKAAKVSSKPNEQNIEDIKDDEMYFEKFKKIADFDTRSVRSFKSIKSEVAGEKQMSKKDKMKLRHDIFLHKIDNTIKSRNESKKRNRKLKKAISGNLVPLHDALPSLKSLLRPKDAPVVKTVNEPKQKAVYKTSTRKRKMKNEKELFAKLLNHPTFKSNPQVAISSHIQASLCDYNKDQD